MLDAKSPEVEKRGPNYVQAAPALVEIAKIERKKKRTPSMSMAATFCPFCGIRYAAPPAVAEGQGR